MLIAFHKPFGVLSQFTPEPGSKWKALAEFGLPKDVYPIGRLDADSEGLLLLSDEKGVNAKLLTPERGHTRTYWAQVEGIPSPERWNELTRGIEIENYRTLPAQWAILDPPPSLPDRDPPIRFRKEIPTTWVALTLVEGKNRQVRRMTAAVGNPTLRLIRIAIGDFHLHPLAPGDWRPVTPAERAKIFRSIQP